MPANPALRDFFLTRRSVGIAFLKEPGPTAQELRDILLIGTRVPDHGKLVPWRLVVFAGRGPGAGRREARADRNAQADPDTR